MNSVYIFRHQINKEQLNGWYGIGKKMYPTQLEKTLKIQRRVISFHLDALEKAKLVKSEFGLTGDCRPQAVRYYSITLKGKDILETLLNMRNK